MERTVRLVARPAEDADSDVIAKIYNQGIDDRVATFETRHRTAGDIEAWLGTRYPIVVVERDGEVIAFAATSSYRARACYDGIAEYSVYVGRETRGAGAGKLAMQSLIAAAADAGFWKLVSRIFTENTASLALMKSLGFREVGTYRNHAKLDGKWRDVVVVELLLGPFDDD